MHIVFVEVLPDESKRITIKDPIENISECLSREFVTNLHFSSSGPGKFYIYKNGELMATLFNTPYIRNTSYFHPIRVQPEDRIEVGVQNRDYQTQDMDVGWEIVKDDSYDLLKETVE